VRRFLSNYFDLLFLNVSASNAVNVVGADVNKVGSGGSSPLAEAARIGSARMVEFLVDQGADVELKNPAYGGATAVVVAVLNRRLTVVEVLIAVSVYMFSPLSRCPMLTWTRPQGWQVHCTHAAAETS